MKNKKYSEEELNRFAELVNEYIESNIVKVYDIGNFAAAALDAFQKMTNYDYETFEQIMQGEETP